MPDKDILCDLRVLFMDNMDHWLRNLQDSLKQMERLSKELSQEFQDSDTGFHLECDYKELWSSLVYAENSAKMLRLHLEQGHDATS